MAALPADIAKFTSDGVLITISDASILTNHPEAYDQADQEIEMFFDSAADATILLQERFDILSQLSPEHEAVVVDESLLLGSDVAVTPTIPCFRAVDEDRDLDKVLRMRAYAYETGADYFSIELMA